MKFARLSAVLTILTFAVYANADILDDVALTVSNTSGSQTFQIPLANFTQGVDGSGLPIWTYIPANPELICAGNGKCLGDLNYVQFQAADDPQVNLFFAIQAGTSDTTFAFNSPTITFPSIANPQAFASAGVTLTNSNGVVDASLTGAYSGGKAYEADYNNPASVFGNLISTPITVSPAVGTTTVSDRVPASGTQTIVGNVSQIQSHFAFVLSANDQASGTSTFSVVPEPSTLILLGMSAVGLIAFARRWRKA